MLGLPHIEIEGILGVTYKTIQPEDMHKRLISKGQVIHPVQTKIQMVSNGQ